MKKAIVKALSVVLVVVITLTSAPLSGFVGLELPEWLNLTIETKGATSNTTIEIADESAKHLLGSSFAVSASYCSDTYSHSSDTVFYEISGPEDGIVLDGGMSCLGTKENGIVSLPFKAVKTGKYVVTLTTIDGVSDSVTIVITTETLDEFLACAIQSKKSIVKPQDILIYKPDMTWTFKESAYTAIGDAMGVSMSETQIVEIIMVRVLLEKLTNDNFIEQMYASTASDLTKCITGAIALDKSITEKSTVNSLSAEVKKYINDFYKFDVFDTLSSVVNGTTTLINAAQTASFYSAVSNSITVEQLKSMIKPIFPIMYQQGYSDVFSVSLLENAYLSLLDVLENVDIKVADYFAETTVKYGVETLKEITKDVVVTLAKTAITTICPPLGLAFSITISAVELAEAIDSFFTGKLEGVEKSLGILNMLGEMYREAIYNNHMGSEMVVESYRFLIATSKIAVDIQKENLDLLKFELIKNKVIIPSLSIGIIETAEMFGNSSDEAITSYSLIAEKYSLSMDNCSEMINDEREFLKKTIEDYLSYVYGSDVYRYNSDLWEISTRYIITYCQNYSNSSYENFSEIDFAYEGDKLDERKQPSARSGYKFTGWYTDATCSEEYNFSASITSDLTLYAGWEKMFNYEFVDSINSRITRVNPSSSTYAMGRATTQNSPLNNVSSQIDVIIPICIDSHIVNEISSGAVPSGINSVFIPESVEYIEDGAIPSSTKIYCESGTYAKEYAESKGYEYVISNDGETNLTSGKFGPLSYLIRDGIAVIRDCDEDYEGTITIPKQIGCYDVTIIGEYAFENCDGIIGVTVPSSIESIEKEAFKNCINLKTATIESGVKNIAYGSFSGCGNLSEMTFPIDAVIDSNGNQQVFGYMFGKTEYEGGKLTTQHYLYPSAPYKYYIPEKLTTITITGNSIFHRAFENCINLTNITLSDEIATIGSYAFSSCSNLRDITIPGNVTKIGSYAFSGCTNLTNITIPGSITEIDSYAFSGCTKLTDITILDGVMNIDSSVFNGTAYYNNPSNWDNKVLYIDNYLIKADVSIAGKYTIKPSTYCVANSAFQDCSLVTQIDIPDSVKSLGDYSPFSRCEKLEEVNIGDGVTKLPVSLFNECRQLKRLTIGSGVSEGLSSDSFSNSYYMLESIEVSKQNNFYSSVDGVLFNKNCSTLILYPAKRASDEYVVPSTVTRIENNAFNFYGYCGLLSQISLPNGLISIGDSAFECCRIKSFSLPESLETIGANAFSRCDSYYFKTINIPKKVKIIGDGAFNGCDYLTEINVAEGNSMYCSQSGVLYNADKTILLQYPAGNLNKVYIIPETVMEIADYAFSGYMNLESIGMPSGLKKIGWGNFDDRTIQNILYPLSSEDWDNIDIQPNNSELSSANYHFNFDLVHSENVASTCLEKGHYKYVCACGFTLSGEHERADCDFQVTNVVAPTCTTKGYTLSKCSFCGSECYSDEIKVLGHDLKEEVCIRCGIHVIGINLGDLCTAVITSPNEIALHRFIPQNSGTYCFYSDSTNDTYGYVYDDCMNVLSSNDDGGNENNFLITYSFIAGETYYLGAKFLSSDKTGEFYIRLTTEYTPGYNELVSDEGIVVTPVNSDVLPINTTLNVTLLETTDISIVYDITLMNNGIEIQPSGLVAVKLPVPKGVDGNSISVYRWEKDGTYTNMNAIYENGYMVFTTDHFSKYMMTLEVPTAPDVPDEPIYNYTFSIQNPSRTEIRHKDGIKLHTSIEGTAPAGAYVKWTANNSNFKTEQINDGNSLKIVSEKNGYTTFTATLYSKDGEVLATDTIEMKSKAGFFDKFGSFFRSLFGGTKIYEN